MVKGSEEAGAAGSREGREGGGGGSRGGGESGAWNERRELDAGQG